MSGCAGLAIPTVGLIRPQSRWPIAALDNDDGRYTVRGMKDRRYGSRTIPRSNRRPSLVAKAKRGPMGFQSERPKSTGKSLEAAARAAWRPGTSSRKLAKAAGISPATAAKYKRVFKAEVA